MATVMKLGPVTRVEGHLEVELTIDTVNGVQQVTDAKSVGAMFRGFEKILVGRDPRDATVLTQRICGVCPVSHGMASSLALEKAFALTAPTNGRILRNLILGANFVQSHLLHFYHLNAADYIDTTGLLDMSPWTPRYVTPDMVSGTTASTLVNHYVQALAMRRKAHQMGAILGGKLPHTPAFVVGGATLKVTSSQVTAFRTILSELRTFINNVYIKDVQLVANAFAQYNTIGKGPGNLLAYGVFDLDNAGTTKLLKRGRYTGGSFQTVDVNAIKEYVKYSWYASTDTNRNPTTGTTTPSAIKTGAYSWVKAPRYLDAVHEVGPLARMYINGDYRNGIGVNHRLMARALEAKKVADAMDTWLNQLVIGQASYTYKAIPATASGIGLTEAARGALGHWMSVSASKVARYQIITPTAWNASPRDDAGRKGAIEQALIGTPVKDINQPIEVLRVIHSFDPCLSCSVHMARPGKAAELVIQA